MEAQPKPHNSDGTSLSLLQRVKQNDSMAWERLVEVYSPLIYAWCKRCGLTGEDGSDILQEVFTSVANNISKFRRENKGDTFRGWLRVITRNHINGFFRKQANQPQAKGGSTANQCLQELPDNALEEPEEQSGGEQSTLNQRMLQLILDEFEERTRQAFLQMTMHNRSAADVGADLDMTSGAVRQAKYSVLRRLRQEFGDMLD